MKLIIENFRKFLTEQAINEKMMLKPGPNGWDKYCELVAEAYAKAPKFDESAVSSFEAMKPFVDKMFKRIEGVVDIKFVEEHPYADAEELKQDVDRNGVLISRNIKSYHAAINPKLIKNKVSGAPGFNIENIYVFAGIPSIVEAMMAEFVNSINNKNKFYSSSIITKLFESKIANILAIAEKNFKDVLIGSYPIFDDKPRGVEIVISSLFNKKNVQIAKKFIQTEINKII